MKRTLHIFALAAFTLIGMTSCMKDGEITILRPKTPASALELRADSLKNSLIGNHYLPVLFWSDTPIDYIETNNTITLETDLTKYIMPYIKDDVIPFNADKTLPAMQNMLKMPGADSAVLNRHWDVSISKEKNELYLTYLDYYYAPLTYTVTDFDKNHWVGYVKWTSLNVPANSSNLYTRFVKQ